jgi:hypothetical protein
VSDLDGDVEPLSRLGPSDVELVLRGENEVVWIVVNGVFRIVELGV